MREITLDELVPLSDWPERLLRHGFSTAPRTRLEALGEYEERYAPLLAAYEADPQLTLSDLRRMEIGDFQRRVAMSVGETLYEAILGEAVARGDRLVFDTVVSEIQVRKVRGRRIKTVVDLGCGWGYLLGRLGMELLEDDVELRGVELSTSGVALARLLHSYHRGHVEPYDLTSGGPCAVLAAAEPPVLVVSSFTCHQLPSAALVLDLLAEHREKIAAVVAFEPEAGLFGAGLLGLLRRRYGEVRGYSADLLAIAGSRRDFSLLSVRANAVGTNALLPGTLSIWQFQ